MSVAKSRCNRSSKQADASRANGSVSLGPVSSEGKMLAAANSIRHGLATRSALLPGESVEQYEAALGAWVGALAPRSLPEAQLAARIADTAFRMERLDRLAERTYAADLEKRVAESEPAQKLRVADEALQAVRALAALAKEITTDVHRDRLVAITPALRFVAERVAMVELPFEATRRLVNAMEAVLIDSIADVGVAAFEEVAIASVEVETALGSKVHELEAARDAERERIADSMIIGDEADLRTIERHRARLARELELHASTLRTIRELGRPTDDDSAPGSFVQLKVELKLIGRLPR